MWEGTTRIPVFESFPAGKPHKEYVLLQFRKILRLKFLHLSLSGHSDTKNIQGKHIILYIYYFFIFYFLFFVCFRPPWGLLPVLGLLEVVHDSYT